MTYDKVKKYKNILVDNSRNVKYIIYSNEKLDKSKMLYYVRLYNINHDKLPEPGSNINIIADC